MAEAIHSGITEGLPGTAAGRQDAPEHKLSHIDSDQLVATPAMASADFVDSYLDPDTGRLKDKVNARTKVTLDITEGDLVFFSNEMAHGSPGASTAVSS